MKWTIWVSFVFNKIGLNKYGMVWFIGNQSAFPEHCLTKTEIGLIKIFDNNDCS